MRQPLAVLKISASPAGRQPELLEIIKEEVNVKEVAVDNDIENIYLNTELTPELIQEGQAREIVRFIQEMRKEAGYEVDNRIRVSHSGASEVFEKFGDLIAGEVLADQFSEEELDSPDLEKEFDIENEKIKICIKR